MKEKITIIRPINLLIIVLTMGIVLGKYYDEYYIGTYWISAILLVLPAILTAAAGYIINDICDITTDIINKPHRATIGRILTKRNAWYLYFSLSFISILISFLLKKNGAYIFTYGYINIGITIILLLYSFFLKGLPLIGNLIVASCSASVVACCLLVAKIESKVGLLNFGGYIIFAFFISLIREIVKDLQDEEGDKAANYNTYPIAVGNKGAKFLIYAILTIQILCCGIYTIIAWGFSQKISAVIMVIIGLSFFYFIQVLGKAKTKEEFGNASTILKFIMVAGVINLIFT
ncbi:MAG: geranylgeranylglycerol-phosphate geranylgeranyltransferase [Bacteroidetes bacterium]|nr:geranylgeranylglycerol-phosphate geranylgeranyltransferase [Bacteroidota bacterium]